MLQPGLGMEGQLQANARAPPFVEVLMLRHLQEAAELQEGMEELLDGLEEACERIEEKAMEMMAEGVLGAEVGVGEGLPRWAEMKMWARTLPDVVRRVREGEELDAAVMAEARRHGDDGSEPPRNLPAELHIVL